MIKGDEDEFEERTRRLLNLNVMSIAKKKVTTVPWDEDIERIVAVLGKNR